MPGTVTVVAAQRGLSRFGRLKVRVNGRTVGTVRVGGSLELTVENGDHEFQVASGVASSRSVVLSVGEDNRLHLETGARHLLLVPGFVVCWLLFEYLGGVLMAAGAPLLVGLAMFPGTLAYLRVAPPEDAPLVRELVLTAAAAGVADQGPEN